jgi:hypothetical protein
MAQSGVDTSRVTTPVPPAFLILSTARSGSSLAVNVLGGHPQLYGVPELRLFNFATIHDLLSHQLPNVSTTQRLAGLLRALAQVHENEQTTASIDRALEWLQSRRRWRTLDVFRHLQLQLAPRFIVEKSPETASSEAAIHRALSVGANSSIVHLVRHPWATVASMVDAWTDLPYWNVNAHHVHEYCARVWLDQHTRISKSSSFIPNYSLIRIEDLTDPGTQVLETFCAFAGIDASPTALAAMRLPERSPFARRGPTNAAAGLDQAFLDCPQLRQIQLPTTLEPPSRWRLGSSTVRKVQFLAETYGYSSKSREFTGSRKWRMARTGA